MSVFSEIERLEGAKNALATSIEGKGVAVPAGTKIDGMAALVDQIQGGGGSDFYIDDARYLFYQGARFSEKDRLFSSLKNVKSMYGMFERCVGLKSFCFSEIDTSKVETMENMFYYGGLTSISFDGIDTSSSPNMRNMFYWCRSITGTVDFGPVDTTTVHAMSGIFDECVNIEELLNFSSIGAVGQGGSMFPCGNMYGVQSKLRRLTFKTNLPDGEYAIRSAIDLTRSSFTRDGMVEMFNTLPDISGLTLNDSYKKITITANPCVTDGTLTDEDKAIAIGKGWTIVI